MRAATEEEIARRLDLKILREFRDNPADVRKTRNWFIENWADSPNLAGLSLSDKKAIARSTAEQDQAAVKSIVDYNFEPHFVSTMKPVQLRDYFLDVTKIFDIDIQNTFPNAGRTPLLIEGLHHRCSFSFVFTLIAKFLMPEFGYNSFITLYTQDEPDIRLVGSKNIIDNMLGGRASGIKLSGGWYRRLRTEMTDRTVIFYMGDMAPKLFPKNKSKINRLVLTSDAAPDFEVDVLSDAARLAQKLGAEHYSWDIKKKDTLRLRRVEADDKADLTVPVYDWVFWPALDDLYSS